MNETKDIELVKSVKEHGVLIIFRLLYVNDSSFFECCDKSHNSRISQAETVSVYKYVRSSDDKTYDEKGDSEYQSNDTPGQL